jgi:SAM-dependent methyltransferase
MATKLAANGVTTMPTQPGQCTDGQTPKDCFLSYASTQESYAKRLATLISDAGFTVFDYQAPQNWNQPAKSLPGWLTEIIGKARCCVILADEAYIASKWCMLESEAAHDRFDENIVQLGKFNPDVQPKGSLKNAKYWDLRNTLAEEFAQVVIGFLKGEKSQAKDIEPDDRERRYGLFFGFPGYRVAYIPVAGSTWYEHYQERSVGDLSIEASSTEFVLKVPFDGRKPAHKARENLTKCRLSFYSSDDRVLRLGLQPTNYVDYLRSGEVIDFEPIEGGRTLREQFLEQLGPNNAPISPFGALTNICGVGVFVITHDGQVVVSSHSYDSHVYPGRRTFSASGTIPWGACLDPFAAALIKTHEEIQHLVDPRKLKLFGFGVDARKLYFQFSFVEERTAWSFSQIESHYNRWKKKARNAPRELAGIDFNEESVCESLTNDCWEPAAEAALMALLAKHFSKPSVEKALGKRKANWWKRAMRDEWDHRASRPGLLPDMSVRYPRDRLEVESRRYLEHVGGFIGAHVRGKRVVEIGPGTGRVSELLLTLGASQLTCIELSPRMIARLRERLRNAGGRVEFQCGFAQEYLPGKTPFDIVVCSLVLVHNVGTPEFKDIVRRMCLSARCVFVFEDVRQRESSPATQLRSKQVILDEFGQNGFRLDREENHSLFDDEIAFLHLSSS